jgi:hypothetical protein
MLARCPERSSATPTTRFEDRSLVASVIATRYEPTMVGARVVALVIVALAIVGCLDRRRERERYQMLEEERAQLDTMRALAAAGHPDASTASSVTGSFVAQLAAIAKDPTRTKPTTTQTAGELDAAVYAIAGFEHAELQRVHGHPEAWSWLLNGSEHDAEEFGPPGSVRDLMAEAPGAIAGYQLHGLLLQIGAGPLAGAVIVHDPGTKSSFQVATVAYHQQTHSLVMNGLCEFGAVPGVVAHMSSAFHDWCFGQVAAKLHRPVEELFPSPWMIQDVADSQCNRALNGSVPGARSSAAWARRPASGRRTCGGSELAASPRRYTVT